MVKIRKAVKEDLKELTAMYKKIFKVHNIFTKGNKEIMEYLEQFLGNILVAEEKGKIIGGIVISGREYDGWKLYNFKHVAVLPKNQRKGIGTKLLKEAEKFVGFGKIEIRVAAGASEAPWAVEFYEQHGYKKEGELESHYRHKETCYVMGKVIK